MDFSTINFNEIADANFAPLPAGTYKAVITEAIEKQTKAGTGSYLSLTIEVIDGEHKGKKVFDNLNLNNPNQTAVQIAQQTLKSIIVAIGKQSVSTEADLLNIPLAIKTSIRKSAEYGDKAEVKAYLPLSKAPAMPATAPAQAFHQPAPAPIPPAQAFDTTNPPIATAPAQAQKKPWEI